MGRNMGIEPMHTGATIRRVNHFTNSAMTKICYQILLEKASVFSYNERNGGTYAKVSNQRN